VKKLASVSASAMVNAIEFRETVEDSLTDELTGLQNLRALREFFSNELAKNKTPCAILMMDMDNLKWINDNFGHVAGDEVLRKVAATIRSELRAEDECFRYGGDEFVAVVRNADPSKVDSLVKRLKDKVAALKFERDGKVFSTGISVGVAFYPADSDNPFTVLSMADGAMYVDKRTHSR